MASKEVMVTAPVLVLLYDRTFVAGSWREVWGRRRFHLALASTWIVLAALMLHSPLTERGVGFGRGISWITYALTECRAVLIYLRLAIWPNPLVFDHGWPFIEGAGAATYLSGVVALLFATLFLAWQNPPAAFGAIWFLGLLAPSSSVVPIIQQPVAESRPYLAIAGLITLAVLTAYRVAAGRMWLGVGLLAVAGCALTV